MGFAGNGLHCGLDEDLDGYPNEDLAECADKNCRKVTFYFLFLIYFLFLMFK